MLELAPSKVVKTHSVDKNSLVEISSLSHDIKEPSVNKVIPTIIMKLKPKPTYIGHMTPFRSQSTFPWILKLMFKTVKVKLSLLDTVIYMLNTSQTKYLHSSFLGTLYIRSKTQVITNGVIDIIGLKSFVV